MRRSVLVALLVAAVGAAGLVVSAVRDPARAVLGWVAAYGFGLGTALAALILAMVFHVTNARWPIVVRPYLMGVASVMPLFALLFLPIAALGERATATSAHQRLWQHPTFFLARAVVYLFAWSALTSALRRADARFDREPSDASALRQRQISAAGLPVVALTLTFASFDWFMAVQPGWVSTMYGLYFFAGGLASAVSLVVVAVWRTNRRSAPENAPGPAHFHALGRLMLMATVLWAYLGFFQLLIVWIANLPREVSFYVARSRGAYRALDAVLLFGHFVVPFLALLSRPLKRRPGLLACVAAWLVLMHAVDLVWLVLPAATGAPGVIDVAPFLVISGLAVAYGVQRFHAAPAPTPSSESGLAESLRYESP